MSLQRIKDGAISYKAGNPIESTWTNKHMNELHTKITATRDAVDQVIDLFVSTAEQSRKFDEQMSMLGFLDQLKETSRTLSRHVLSLLSQTGLSKTEADAIIVDFANHIAAPIDFALYTEDIQ